MQEESFKNRYLIKIASSIVIAILNIIIQMILPRAFSVEEFGYYSYNLNVFTSTVVLANLSMSNALVAKFSKRNDEIGILFFYFKYYLIEIIVLSIGLILLFPTAFAQKTFAGQTLSMVLLGLESAAIIKFLSDVISVYDSMAIAKASAGFQILLKVLICVFAIVTYLGGKLNLITFYLGQVLFTFVISATLFSLVIKHQKEKYPVEKIASNKEYAVEYLRFCKPLIISSAFSQAIIIFMNWCLMRFSGATEQAMFGAAWQLNALVTYVFSPYAELSKREYAVIASDTIALRKFYDCSLKRMIWLTSYFACFIGFCNDWIVKIIYGDGYSDAGIVIVLMMLYTVYQAWGQMSGSFMLATEKTKMNATLGIVGQLITVCLVFVFQIPNFIWPNGLGSIGIALVYVIGNFISVCISVFFTTRSIGMNSGKELLVQVVPITLCALLAYSLNHVCNITISSNSIVSCLFKLVLAGCIYTAVLFAVVLRFPSQVALDKTQIKSFLEKIRTVIRV